MSANGHLSTLKLANVISLNDQSLESDQQVASVRVGRRHPAACVGSEYGVLYYPPRRADFVDRQRARHRADPSTERLPNMIPLRRYLSLTGFLIALVGLLVGIWSHGFTAAADPYSVSGDQPVRYSCGNTFSHSYNFDSVDVYGTGALTPESAAAVAQQCRSVTPAGWAIWGLMGIGAILGVGGLVVASESRDAASVTPSPTYPRPAAPLNQGQGPAAQLNRVQREAAEKAAAAQPPPNWSEDERRDKPRFD